MYIGRSVALYERWKRHHRVPLLETLGGVKVAWLEQSNSFALSRLEKTLIKYFNPPLNRLPLHLSKGNTETLIKELNLKDSINKNNLIPITKCMTSQPNRKDELLAQIQTERNLHLHCGDGGWSPSEFKEIILEQAKSIEHLQERLSDLRLMFQEQMNAHRQLTEALVEQAKAISELSRTQAETNSRSKSAQQALTSDKLSSILEETFCEHTDD